MKQLAQPAFYANKDRSHCVQACLKSVLSVTHPDKDFSWEQLEELTDYIPGHGAWVYKELLTLSKYGLEVEFITNFNIGRFIKEGSDYIEDEYGKEVADYERDKPHDHEKLKVQMQESLDKGLTLQRASTKDDIKNYIDDGWYVMLLLNSKALNDKEGYTGHRVLIYGYDDEGAIMHDPGPNENNNTESREVSWDKIDAAWGNAKELVAVREKK